MQRLLYISQQLRHPIQVCLEYVIQRTALRSRLCGLILRTSEEIPSYRQDNGDEQEVKPVPERSFGEASPLPPEVVAEDHDAQERYGRDDARGPQDPPSIRIEYLTNTDGYID